MWRAATADTGEEPREITQVLERRRIRPFLSTEMSNLSPPII